MTEIFSTCVQNNNTRNTTPQLCQPYRKTNKVKKDYMYPGTTIWNNIYTKCKLIANINTFKHTLKTRFLINSWRMMQRFTNSNFDDFPDFFLPDLSVWQCCVYCYFSSRTASVFLCKNHYEKKVGNLSCVILASVISFISFIHITRNKLFLIYFCFFTLYVFLFLCQNLTYLFKHQYIPRWNFILRTWNQRIAILHSFGSRQGLPKYIPKLLRCGKCVFKKQWKEEESSHPVLHFASLHCRHRETLKK